MSTLTTAIENSSDPSAADNPEDPSVREALGPDPTPTLSTISVPADAMNLDTPCLDRLPEIGHLPIPTFPNEEFRSPISSPTSHRSRLSADKSLWDQFSPISTPAGATPAGPTNNTSLLRMSLPLGTPHLSPEGTAAPTPTPPPGNNTISVQPQTSLRDLMTSGTDPCNPAKLPCRAPRDPLDKYIKADMPEIHDLEPRSLLELIDLDRLDEWDRCPGGKLVAVPFRDEAEDPDWAKFVQNRIFAAAAEITKAQLMGISTPRPNELAHETHRTPTTFLIYNLTDSQRQILLQQRVWSSKDITFRVAPLGSNIPSYLFTVSGLTTLNLQSIRDMVLDTWLDDESCIFFQLTPQPTNSPEHSNISPILEDLVNSIQVEQLPTKDEGGILAPVFHILASSPRIPNHQVWSQIRNFLAKRNYEASLEGSATIRVAPFDCTLCHGISHPRGLCPFTKIIGWNAPMGPPENKRPRRDNDRGRFPRNSRRWTRTQ